MTAIPSVTAADPAAVDASFREALAHFCTGVVVVTSLDGSQRPVGMTVGSFTSISLDPPLVGFYAGRTSTTLPHIAGRGRFCVNVLAADQHELARTFAVSDADKFAGVGWFRGRDGCPRLTGAHAWIDCSITLRQTIGDHDLVVGHVEALAVSGDSDPLVFHRSIFRSLKDAS
ncbi:flavin reductase family protein [Nocardia sp. NPDC052254]|uniref:flavin reductase family protein n=1 Tax=Nocardia sp. NPDC052254 TaxID=3155681 RepID=UPI003416E08A